MWINGTDYGAITTQGGVAVLDFDSIFGYADKMSINNWTAGSNSIDLMPYAEGDNANYYYYVEDLTAHSLGSDEAKTALSTNYPMSLYSRYSTPTDPRVELTYSDGAKHNLGGANLSLGNSTVETEYSIIAHYRDYYDGMTEKTAPFLGLQATFDGTTNKGIAMYSLIKNFGPHEMWFEVIQTGTAGLANEDYYLNSASVSTDKFINSMALPEFSGDETSVGASIVTAITSDNATGGHDTNGALKWTLPTSPYDININYSVYLRDENGSDYTAETVVTVRVGSDGVAVYQFLDGSNPNKPILLG